MDYAQGEIESAIKTLRTHNRELPDEIIGQMEIALTASLDGIPAQPSFSPIFARASIRDAVTDSLGEAYDCTRVWSAWGEGTMDQDDFTLVSEDPERVEEIVDAVLEALTKDNGSMAIPAGWSIKREHGGITIRQPDGGFVSVKRDEPDNRIAHEVLHDLSDAILSIKQNEPAAPAPAPALPTGWDREELEDIASSLETTHDKTMNVGEVELAGVDTLVETGTAAAARFIRQVLADHHKAWCERRARAEADHEITAGRPLTKQELVDVAYAAPEFWGQVYLTLIFVHGVDSKQARVIADDAVTEFGNTPTDRERVDEIISTMKSRGWMTKGEKQS